VPVRSDLEASTIRIAQIPSDLADPMPDGVAGELWQLVYRCAWEQSRQSAAEQPRMARSFLTPDGRRRDPRLGGHYTQFRVRLIPRHREVAAALPECSD